MKSPNRSIALAAPGAAIATGVYFALLQDSAVPELTITAIEGERFSTADLRGNMVERHRGEPDFAALRVLPEGKLAEKT